MLRPQHVTDGDRDGIRYARRDVAIDIMLMSEIFFSLDFGDVNMDDVKMDGLPSSTATYPASTSMSRLPHYHGTPTATATAPLLQESPGYLASPKGSVSLKDLYFGAVLIFPPNCPNMVLSISG